MNISPKDVSGAQIKSTAPPQMHAIERPWASSLRQTRLLFDIAKAVGGPFHVIHPPSFEANFISFRDILERQGIRGVALSGRCAR